MRMLLIQIASLCLERKPVQRGCMWRGGTEKRKGRWKRHDESIIWTVCECMHVPAVCFTGPSPADGPCYPSRLNAKTVIKVEWSHRPPNPDWHQEAGNLNVFTWWSSIPQRVSFGRAHSHAHICIDRVIHTGRLTVMRLHTHIHTGRFVNISTEWLASS